MVAVAKVVLMVEVVKVVAWVAVAMAVVTVAVTVVARVPLDQSAWFVQRVQRVREQCGQHEMRAVVRQDRRAMGQEVHGDCRGLM